MKKSTVTQEQREAEVAVIHSKAPEFLHRTKLLIDEIFGETSNSLQDLAVVEVVQQLAAALEAQCFFMIGAPSFEKALEMLETTEQKANDERNAFYNHNVRAFMQMQKEYFEANAPKEIVDQRNMELEKLNLDMQEDEKAQTAIKAFVANSKTMAS